MMLKQKNIAALGGSLLVFLGAAYVPNTVLKVTVNTYVGVALSLSLILWVLRSDPVLALAVLLAVGALFLENRKRLVAKLDSKFAYDVTEKGLKPASVASLSVPAPDLIEGEVHPESEIPDRESHSFAPESDSGSDDFKAVGESIDQKIPPLETVSSNSSQNVAQFLTRLGVAN